MSVETRHTEKTLLFNLLLMSHGKLDLKMTLSQLLATMEPEDVELVEKRVAEFIKGLEG